MGPFKKIPGRYIDVADMIKDPEQYPDPVLFKELKDLLQKYSAVHRAELGMIFHNKKADLAFTVFFTTAVGIPVKGYGLPYCDLVGFQTGFPQVAIVFFYYLDHSDIKKLIKHMKQAL